MVYVLLVEVAALAAVVWSASRTTTGDQWVLCAVLTGSAMIHMHLSYAIERVRRDHSHTPHVDLCSIWILAGALLPPPLPATLLIVGIYTHRWWLVVRWDASRPPHRIVFTAATMVLARWRYPHSERERAAGQPARIAPVQLAGRRGPARRDRRAVGR